MKAQKPFWERHLAKIIGAVLVIALFGTLGILRYQQEQKPFRELRDKLTMFKKPPVDAAEGGHWHPDGTWHNEPHETPKAKPEPKMTEKSTEPHPHDLLTDEEHAEVHRIEEEALKLLAESENMLLDTLSESERAYVEAKEFEKLIPNFTKQILEYEDYDFILTYPTAVQMIEKFPTPESLVAFCKRLKEFQSLIIEISNEIHKRPALARKMQREDPNFMENLKKVSELEIPQLYTEGTK